MAKLSTIKGFILYKDISIDLNSKRLGDWTTTSSQKKHSSFMWKQWTGHNRRKAHSAFSNVPAHDISAECAVTIIMLRGPYWSSFLLISGNIFVLKVSVLMRLSFNCIFVDILLTLCPNTDPHSPKETASGNTLLLLELLTQGSHWRISSEVPGVAQEHQECHSRSQGMHTVCMKQAGYSPMAGEYLDVRVQHTHLHTWQTRGSLCLKETKK